MIEITTESILKNAKGVKNFMMMLDENAKNYALNCMADALVENQAEILLANKKDVENAASSISSVMIDRLKLDEKRVLAMAQGIREVATLNDPVNKVISKSINKDGLEIKKVCVPIGVVAIIYESRPNVTSDAAALCIKSSNVCVLRVGKEAFLSANAIVNALRKGLEKAGIPKEVISLVQDTSRNSSYELMNAVGLVDLLIPRGGAGLIKACVENAKVPCIQTGTGICHIFVDKDANFDMAIKIIVNAKTSRPSVCNAEEVLLVSKDIANEFLPLLKSALVDDRIKQNLIPVELRLDDKSSKIISGTIANDNDFDTEFLDYILAVKVVDGVDEAISHISMHSTGHSDGIISNNEKNIDKFILSIDSSAVYVNASTRFTDGGEFGLGCEMGISTQKLHARGPMGIFELTTYKYVVKGNGQTRG